MSSSILKMCNITKKFGKVNALSSVNLDVHEAEIHAICGENGAGKSTLMSILSGVYPFGSYEGDIYYKGQKCQFRDVRDSEALGIVIIHQEFALVPFLSIAENIFLGNEPSVWGIIQKDKMIQGANKLMQKVGLHENPYTHVSEIGVAKQQLVEIAKAFSKNVKLLILDEPTACLSDKDSALLLDLLVQLKKQGITSILISHKLNEISRVADRITVIRDGQTVDTMDNKDLSEDRIVSSIVGRTIENRYPPRNPKIGKVVFEVKDWLVYHPEIPDKKIIQNVDLCVRKGEVVGLAGLMGSGRTEFAMSIFGKSYGVDIGGEVSINNRRIDTSTVSKAIAEGLAYVTEDRKQYGLNLIDHIRHNITIANLPFVSESGIIDRAKEIEIANDYLFKKKIRSMNVHQVVETLSGGNQQKVLLSKWLFTNPHVLILDEPTRGVDVGAKYEIYKIINQLAEEGKAILVISSDMPELLGICDRLYVLNEGRIVCEMDAHDATQEKIMKAIISFENTNMIERAIP